MELFSKLFFLRAFLIKIIYLLIFLPTILISQYFIESNLNNFPSNRIYNEFNSYIKNIDNASSSFLKNNAKKYYFSLSYNFQFASNKGHPNIDNNAEFYMRGPHANIISTRMEFRNSWLSIELEPYILSSTDTYNAELLKQNNTYVYNNNHGAKNIINSSEHGFKQSRIIIHYAGIGFGYGRESHWWSPGFHSAIALSSNAPSQESYSFGTYNDVKLGPLSFGAKIIVMPYKSNNDVDLYFSALRSHIALDLNSLIITTGFHRTYLSGNFDNLSSESNNISTWDIFDATKLVIEPLFGQSKSNLDYTQPGTPGFDIWDEILTGYIKLSFPNDNLELYADISSDDNRGNLTDLLAHWDHTLGYLFGIKKLYRINSLSFFTGLEFLTTRVSNTFKPEFYRGGEPDNYYAKSIYDYFTYKGRRMGAHSGSSSDDFILLIGIGNQKHTAFLSINKERHGIKSQIYPELKNEISLTYLHKINKKHSAFITLEYEEINNFGFMNNNKSLSKLLWLGYSFSIF